MVRGTDGFELERNVREARLLQAFAAAATSAYSSSSSDSALTKRTGRPTTTGGKSEPKRFSATDRMSFNILAIRASRRKEPAEDLGALQAAAGQKRLQRLDQASFFVRVQIPLNAFGAAPALDCGASRFTMAFQIKQRTKRFSESDGRRKLGHLYIAACGCEGNRAVRCAEIQAKSHIFTFSRAPN